MREPLVDNAQKYAELQAEVEEIQDEISEMQRDTFGVESEETEEKARELFAEVGSAGDGSNRSDEIDALREKRAELESDLDTVREELLEQLADIRFPLDGTIETEEERVVIPYDEPIQEDVLDAIGDVLAVNLNENHVSIKSDAIEVQTDSTDEAIEAVERRVMTLRDTANAQYDAAEHVDELYERDDKVAGMMYTLSESGEPLIKSELEKAMGLESGDLRGQLYYVLNNDPYLKKPDQEVQLTSTGQMVIDEYVDQYGVPTWGTEDGESEEMEA